MTRSALMRLAAALAALALAATGGPALADAVVQHYRHVGGGSAVELLREPGGLQARFVADGRQCTRPLPADGGYAILTREAASDGEPLSGEVYRFDDGGCAIRLELLEDYVFVALSVCRPAAGVCPALAPFGLYRRHDLPAQDAAAALRAHNESEAALRSAWAALLRAHQGEQAPDPLALTQLGWQARRDRLCADYEEGAPRWHCLRALNVARTAMLHAATPALALAGAAGDDGARAGGEVRAVAIGEPRRRLLIDTLREPLVRALGEHVLLTLRTIRSDGRWAYLCAVPGNPGGAPLQRADHPLAGGVQALLRRLDGEPERWRVEELSRLDDAGAVAAWQQAHPLPPALFGDRDSGQVNP